MGGDHPSPHTGILVEPSIRPLIYRKYIYIYLYYTQAVMLREGPGHPMTAGTGWDVGVGEGVPGQVRGNAGRRLTVASPVHSWEGQSPSMLLRESQGFGVKFEGGVHPGLTSGGS